jgi:hypothetical protein
MRIPTTKVTLSLPPEGAVRVPTPGVVERYTGNPLFEDAGAEANLTGII